jgi:hypothetical protein
MDSVSRLKSWLGWGGPPPSRAANAEGVAVRPRADGHPGLEWIYLLDEPQAVATETLRASIDTLACQYVGDRPLPLTVLHRGGVDAARRRLFDAARRLDCTHLDGSALGPDPVVHGEYAHLWRHAAALSWARQARAPWYGVLDDTTITLRPLEPGRLFDGERAVSQWEPANTHPQALVTAQELAGGRDAPAQAISTAPALLCTALAQHALRVIEGHGPGTAEQRLAAFAGEGRDVAFNLVYSVAAGAAELARHHRPALEQGHLAALHGDVCLWGGEPDLDKWDPAAWAAVTHHGQFLVVKCQDPKARRGIAARSYGVLRG